MAAERTPGAKADPAAGAKAKTGGKMGAWLPLIITIAVMPVLAFGMTRWVIVPQLQKNLGISPAHTEATSEEGEGGGADSEGHGGSQITDNTVTLSKVLVNVSGTMGSRYLLSSYVIAGKGSDFQSNFEKNHPKLVDLAGSILSTKTISDLEKPNARNLIRSELMSAFNGVLGNNAVQDIYITEFAIQ